MRAPAPRLHWPTNPPAGRHENRIQYPVARLQARNGQDTPRLAYRDNAGIRRDPRAARLLCRNRAFHRGDMATIGNVCARLSDSADFRLADLAQARAAAAHDAAAGVLAAVAAGRGGIR